MMMIYQVDIITYIFLLQGDFKIHYTAKQNAFGFYTIAQVQNCVSPSDCGG